MVRWVDGRCGLKDPGIRAVWGADIYPVEASGDGAETPLYVTGATRFSEC